MDDQNAAPPDPPETAVQSHLPQEETWSPPGSSGECSPENFPPADGLYDGTDT